MNIFSLFKKPKVADPDEAVISQLKNAGSNLSKPHKIDFFLYFGDEIAATNVKDIIQKENPSDSMAVEKSAQGNGFVLQLQRIIVPDLSVLQDVRIRFNELAQKYGGRYDGWGTEIGN